MGTSTGGQDPVSPLKATVGTKDNRLSPFFLNPDSYVAKDLTISSHCGFSLN